MLAFTDTEVDKPTLLRVLAMHEDADRIAQRTYWSWQHDTDFGHAIERGCAVGCSLHNFRPGEESNHSLFAPLFGIPVRLARLEDHLFESLTESEDYRGWPMRFTAAIPVGADLSDVVSTWIAGMVERAGPHSARMRNVDREFYESVYDIIELVRDEPDTLISGRTLPQVACDLLVEIMEAAPVPTAA